MPPVNGQRYYASTAVLLNEVIKLAISLTMALYEIMTNPKASDASMMDIFEELAAAVFTGDSWKMAIPAVLYTLQNSLQYIAAGNLDAATFQVTSQLKILTTAIFSVVLLGKMLDTRRWLSLILLMVGVAVVSYPVGHDSETVLTINDLKESLAPHPPRNIWDLKALGNVAAGQLTKRSATYEGIDEDVANQNPHAQAGAGLLALTTACILSGLAGVYFEKIVKEPKSNAHSTSVWVRNVQLSFYSIWPALLIGVQFKDGEHIAKDGFFAGYNYVVWTAIVFQAVGGMTVALVIKYADNIAKNFATSFSIILSFLASVSLFDFEITAFVSHTLVYSCHDPPLTSLPTVPHRHSNSPRSNLPLQPRLRPEQLSKPAPPSPHQRLGVQKGRRKVLLRPGIRRQREQISHAEGRGFQHQQAWHAVV